MSTVKIKGIYQHVRTGKWVAQYWNKDLKTTICIGANYETQKEAIDARARYVTNVYDGIIDDSLPRTKGYPKGIAEITRSNKYKAVLQFWHGKYNDKKTSVYIGSYETIEEAVEARKKYILDLL